MVELDAEGGRSSLESELQDLLNVIADPTVGAQIVDQAIGCPTNERIGERAFIIGQILRQIPRAVVPLVIQGN